MKGKKFLQFRALFNLYWLINFGLFVNLSEIVRCEQDWIVSPSNLGSYYEIVEVLPKIFSILSI